MKKAKSGGAERRRGENNRHHGGEEKLAKAKNGVKMKISNEIIISKAASIWHQQRHHQ
jgi:hypothetical protein